MENSLVVSQSAGAVNDVGKKFSESIIPYIEEWFNSDELIRLSEQSKKSYCKSLIGRNSTKQDNNPLKKKSTCKTAFALWLDSQGINTPDKQAVKDWTKAMDAEKLSAATKNLRLTVVRNFFKWLNTEYGLPNIADLKGWKGAKDKEHQRGFLSCEQMRELMAAVDTAPLGGKKNHSPEREQLERKRDKAIIGTLLAAGLRTVEISRLCIGDVKSNGGLCYLAVLGKGQDTKIDVKLSRKAEQLIQDWLAAREKIDVVSDDSPLFCSLGNNSFGERLSSNSVSTLCKKYLEHAGLKTPQIVAHSLRHSLATNSLLKGATLGEVQQQLRHSNLSTTQIYLHEVNKARNRCTDLIADEIF